MATQLAQINALAARCRKVGWKVTSSRTAGGGYRVVCPDGHIATLHSTLSSENGVRLAEKELDAHGLSAAEVAAKEARETEAQQRMAEERKAAQRRGDKLAREAALTSKAAGPYAEPEHVPFSWFVADHPAPWMRWCIITPQLAKQLLTLNVDNRPMRQTLVETFRRSIEAGLWRRTHQGGAIDTNHVLQDGQHRLQACVDAERDIVMPFFVGMPPENFKTIDEGRTRSVGDLLGKDGETDVALIGATVRLVIASREAFPRNFMRQRTPNAVLYDEFKGDPDALREACRWARPRTGEARLVTSALAAARYLLAAAHEPGNCYVSAFLSGLVTGVKGSSRLLLDDDDPRHQLRTQLQRRRENKQRTSALEQLALILWAWNGVVTGRRARGVRWAEVEQDIPQISLCADKGRKASAPPELLAGEYGAAHQ